MSAPTGPPLSRCGAAAEPHLNFGRSANQNQTSRAHFGKIEVADGWRGAAAAAAKWRRHHVALHRNWRRACALCWCTHKHTPLSATQLDQQKVICNETRTSLPASGGHHCRRRFAWVNVHIEMVCVRCEHSEHDACHDNDVLWILE